MSNRNKRQKEIDLYHNRIVSSRRDKFNHEDNCLKINYRVYYTQLLQLKTIHPDWAYFFCFLK